MNNMQTSTLSQGQITARLGQFNSSENHKLMGVKGLGKTGETYIMERVTEYLTGQPVRAELNTAAINWGIEHEPEAKAYFEAATRLKILNSETLNNGEISGTPDGIVEREPYAKSITTGIEIKCPFNSCHHLQNLMMCTAMDLLDLRPEYYWQIVCYMWLTDLKKWKFCSYDPRFKGEKRMLILNIELNEDHLKLLKNRVTEAKLIFNNILSKIK